MNLDDWGRVLDVNLTGVILGIRAGASAMSGNGGVIVNISSTAGLMGYRTQTRKNLRSGEHLVMLP